MWNTCVRLNWMFRCALPCAKTRVQMFLRLDISLNELFFFFSIKFLRVDFLDIEEIFDGIIIFEHFLYGGWMFLKVIENSGLSSECIWWITGCCYFLYVQVFFIN